MNRKLSLKILAGSVALIQGGELLAQQVLEEVVVTAQRRAENVQDVPIAISAFSNDAMRALGMDNADDLAKQTPGLQWKGAFQYSSPTIFLRGIGDNTFQANNVSAVGLYFDEVYVSSGSTANQALLDLERVEVLKGPQGTLYGRNTTGGAINFISNKPEIHDGFYGRGSATVAEYGEFDLDAALNVPLTGSSALRVAASMQTADGPYDYTEINQDGPDSEAYAWRVSYLNEIGEDLQLLLNVHGTDNEAGTLGKQAGALALPLQFGPEGSAVPCANPGIGNAGCGDFGGFSGSADLTEDHSNIKPQEDIDAGGITLTLQWFVDDLTLTSISAYEQNDRDIVDDLDHSPGDWTQNDWFTSAQQFSQEIRLTSEGHSTLRWTAGAFYFREDLQSYQAFALRDFGPGGVSLATDVLEGLAQRADQDNTSYALFGEAYYDITERLTATLGARWTYEEKEVALDAWVLDVSGTTTQTVLNESFARSRTLFPTVVQNESEEWREWTGKFALDYLLNDTVLLFASASRSFKAGGYNGGALFDQAEAAVVDPEFLNAYELGLKADILSDTLRINASLFHYDFLDQQVFVLRSGAGFPVQSLDNAGESAVQGAELELRWQPIAALYATLGASWLDAEFEEFDSGAGDLSGNSLPAAPELTGNGLLRYSWLLGSGAELALQADFTYTDDQYFEATNNPILSEEAYFLGNLRATYTWAGGDYSLTVWGENVADEEYVTEAFDNAALGWYIFVPGRPRTLGLTLNAQF